MVIPARGYNLILGNHYREYDLAKPFPSSKFLVGLRDRRTSCQLQTHTPCRCGFRGLQGTPA